MKFINKLTNVFKEEAHETLEKQKSFKILMTNLQKKKKKTVHEKVSSRNSTDKGFHSICEQ